MANCCAPDIGSRRFPYIARYTTEESFCYMVVDDEKSQNSRHIIALFNSD